MSDNNEVKERAKREMPLSITSLCTLEPHHLEGLGDEDSKHPNTEEDEQRRGQTNSGCDPLCHPTLPPGALTAA